MSNPQSVFNDFICPRCGTSIAFTSDADSLHCGRCLWQDSLFERAPRVARGSNPAATAPMRSQLPPGTGKGLSKNATAIASETISLPQWLKASANPNPNIPQDPPKRRNDVSTILVAGLAAILANFFWLYGDVTDSFSTLIRISQPPLPPSPPEVAAPQEAFPQAVNAAMKAATLTQSAGTSEQWKTVARLWEEAIALMQAVPPHSPDRDLAQQKAIEYQRNLQYAQQRAIATAQAPPPPPPQPLTASPLLPPPPPPPLLSPPPPPQEAFHDAVNDAMLAASLTQNAQTQEQWQQIVSQWYRAIALMQAVPPSHSLYPTAQQKAIEYQNNLHYALQRVASFSN